MTTDEFLKHKAQEDTEYLTAELERRLDLPDGFSKRLLVEDDWSFIIKIHALLEAAVAHAIAESLRRAELDDLIASMSLNGRISKMAVLESLEAVDPALKRFVNELSALRNQLVHKIAHASFDLPGYVGRLEPSKVEEWISAFGTMQQKRAGSETREHQRRLFLRAPKESIWVTARIWLARLYLGTQRDLLERFERVLAAEDE